MEGEVCCVLHSVLKNVLSLLCCAAECCTWPRARRHGAESELRWWVMAASALAVTDGQDTGWLEAGGDAPKSGVMWSDKVVVFFFPLTLKEKKWCNKSIVADDHSGDTGLHPGVEGCEMSFEAELWSMFWMEGGNGSTERKIHELPFKT